VTFDEAAQAPGAAIKRRGSPVAWCKLEWGGLCPELYARLRLATGDHFRAPVMLTADDLAACDCGAPDGCSRCLPAYDVLVRARMET
jgi:hypothetical protein